MKPMSHKSRHLRPKTSAEAFAEAGRFYRNALERLAQAPRGEHSYRDSKPVREACAMGYLAALLAIDAALLARGIHPDKLPTSINGYEDALRRVVPRDGKLREALVVAWQNLHVFGYYRGGVGFAMIQEGFDKAKALIHAMGGQ